MSDVLLVYFTTCCRSMAWFYLKKIQNKFGAKETCNTGGLCKCTCCHKLPLILIEKYNSSACFANQTYPLKYCAQKRAWMDIPTIWNFFNDF